jgi:hypothetical protein
MKHAIDIVEEMRSFEVDHQPDGWPAVKMCQISSLCDEIENLRKRIATAPVAIMDTRDVLGICAPTEEDFPALYAIQGKRVRLVLEEIHDTKQT